MVNYTIKVTDRLLRFDTTHDNVTVTMLPFAQTPNAPYEVHKTSVGDGHTVTIQVDPTTSDYLLPGGATSITLDDSSRMAVYIKIPAKGLSPAYVSGGGGGGTFGGLGIVTFGLDNDAALTNAVGKYGNIHFAGKPFVASLSCVNPPTSGSMVIDMLFSHDNGTTWHTIFTAGGTASPFAYLASAHGLVLFSSTIFAAVTFAVGDLLRVDTTVSGGAQGITGVVRWG